MARALRLEFPGALYHVTSRGNRREAIFEDDADYQTFLNLFGQVCEHMNWRCYAYCLMTNHYHLAIETAEGNLSSGMRQLNGVYTQRYNRRHHRIGHLLQGRYKAIVVDKDSYLLELARYVVLNPVRANMFAHPGQWIWSSYGAMTRHKSIPGWLAREQLLSMFDINEAAACKRYIRFVGAGKNVPDIWRNLRHRLFLGDRWFVESVIEKCTLASDLSEVPRLERRSLAKPLNYYDSHYNDRHEAMRAAYNTGQYTLAEIARHFGVHYSTVSRAVGRRND
jgi:REP element-mobilizing transposase RayT